MAYLDDTGLAHFWDKIKQWIASAASNLVHRTGNETINGIKSFNSKVNVETNEWLPVQLRLPNVDHRNSSYPSGTVYTGIGILDAGDHYPGDFYYLFDSDGSRQWVLRQQRDDGASTSGFRVGYVPGEYDCYATIPTAALAEDSSRIPNTYWVRHATGNTSLNAATASDLASGSVLSVSKGGTGSSTQNFVDLSTNQTISGIKQFNNTVQIRMPYSTAGTTPASDSYANIEFHDKNGNYLSGIQMSNRTYDNYFRLNVIPHDSTAGGSSWYFSASGSTLFPSTPDSPQNGQAITYDWLPKDTRLVHTTGSENISGFKLFLNGLRVASDASGSNTYSIVSNPSYYGSWDFNANNWLWYAPHSNSLLYFVRSLYIYGGLQLEGNSRAIIIKETDFNAAASGESGWAEIKHQDKNDVVNARISFSGEGNKYSRIIFHTKRKNSTTVWTAVGLFDEESDRRFFMPAGNTADNALELGGGGNRWKVVYAATGNINTSDERLKLGISSIPDAVLDAWLDLDFLQFQFTDAVEEKGDGARLHTGMVAQRIASAFAARGLDASRYGLFCYDSWPAEPAMTGDDGEVVSPAREAGDRYSLRYEEALCMEAACMRRENARLKKRVADLEERLAALELKIA